MDQNLLSGLSDLGLGKLEGLDIYNASDKDGKNKNNGTTDGETVVKEENFLFDKTYTCPVCDREFKTKMVRSGRVRSMEPDMDLRPRHEHIDTLKYDMIACPYCGYAGYGKGFQYLTPSQRKAIKENICGSFKPKKEESQLPYYTYDEALERHKLALVNAIVKRGKASEKAYICLKTGWLFRGMREALSPDEPNYDNKKLEYEQTENQFLRNAYDGFIHARESESFPIAGMDQMTLDFLLTNLAIRFEEYDTASRLVASLLSSKTTPARIKDKTRDLKMIILEKMREQKANE
ncbi:MAG: DUF2225 domain-containing protein [Lachnospiraceae bacterium]